MNSEANFLQAGDTIECGKCHPEKYKDCDLIKQENTLAGWKCECICHKSKVGRPTKWDDTIIPRTLEYIDNCEDEEYDWTKSESSGKVDSESWEHRIRVNLPTMEGLALKLDVSRETLYEWKEKYSEFSYTLRKLLHKQQQMLMAKGLSGDYNPTIAKLILSANHGMKEKTEQDITSGGKAIAGFNFIRNDGDNNTDNKTD